MITDARKMQFGTSTRTRVIDLALTSTLKYVVLTLNSIIQQASKPLHLHCCNQRTRICATGKINRRPNLENKEQYRV